ncbi:Hsp70 family protein [Mycolicibacterium flavescens]|uniref:Molecular chaperone n=1 Tax=Mycolicibacterium flavescens TaxID=1776 RepID=A0A1E3RMN9_MYCFV|nr:Hsp70 family protein [Mycolicibacterium flavescens]MCV7281378.1 Hsp70 family protein [Mycolicibacterium flavescens]ODQ91118.1 molecular chaperone [Mycolicibacterium flavescens]
MVDGVGLSVGATNLAAVVVGRTALTRSPVLTRFAHRPPEVGVPGENRNLNERGLILTDFVDRVGDPVGIVAADGSTHRAEVVLADALRAMLYAVGGGRPVTDPVAVTHPAHWRPPAVEALRAALADLDEFHNPALVADSAAALTALQDDPGLPGRGVIALCDFGGSGTSITLVDAANGFAPIGTTVRHTDLSGDLVDQALLQHVLDDLSAAGTIDLTGTSSIGSLTRLRAQCRGAKERLSTASFTSLVAELPGHRSDVRLTRTELDEVLRGPLAGFADALADTIERNGVRGLAAVASVGGGARIPIITTTLSERFRVPVITMGQPELAAAIGGGLAAVRGSVDEGATAMSPAPAAAAAAAAATAMAPEVPVGDAAPQSGSVGALAWSDADEPPEVTAPDPYDYGDAGQVRPQVQFDDDQSWDDVPPRKVPWYRNPAVPLAAGVIGVLVALLAAVVWVMAGDESPPDPASTTAPPMTVTPKPATTTPPSPEPPATQAPPPQTVYQPPPVTQTVTAPPPEPPPSEPPPEPPPSTPEPPPPPTSEPPPTTDPPGWTPPTWSPPTAPYPTIPGLPWVPAPQIPAPPGP